MLERYRAILLDLDGVLYRGPEAIPGAAEALRAIRDAGVKPVFVTNNSARTPEQVAALLAGLGFEARSEEVVTSAMALGGLLPAGARTVYVIGEDGVREALRAHGVEILEGEPEAADVVVVGWDRDVDYAKLKRASLLVQRGARLLATNTDATYPAPDGLWPGAGAILAAVETAGGVTAVAAGKPEPTLFEAAARAAGEGPYLVVGDRLETDVAGARRMGWDSALVLSGVARSADLLRSAVLPDHLVHALGGLLEDPPRVEAAGAEDIEAARGLLSEANLFADDLVERAGDLAVARAGDGTVVAVAGLEVHAADALLRSVAVAPERRGRSVGTLLTADRVARARKAGCERVWLLTETAEPFFAALGFVAVERGDVPAAIEASPAVAGCAGPDARAMRFDVDQTAKGAGGGGGGSAGA